MAIKNVRLGGASDWIDGEVLYAPDLNDTFDATVGTSPVGAIIPWAKTLNLKSAGTSTTGNFSSQIIDAGAFYQTYNVQTGALVNISKLFDPNQYTVTGGSYVISHTWIFNNDAIPADGVKFTNINSQLQCDQAGYTAYARFHIYYIDGSNAYTGDIAKTSGGFQFFASPNPYPKKSVWKVEVEQYCNQPAYTSRIYQVEFPFDALTAKVVTVNSQTSITTDRKVFGHEYMVYDIWATPFNIYTFIDFGPVVTSLTANANQFICSSGLFTSWGITSGDAVEIMKFYDPNTYGTSANGYTLTNTWTINPSATDGLLFTRLWNYLRITSTGYTAWARYRFYYIDGTNAYSSENASSATGWTQFYYTNPYPGKNVWKIELEQQQNSGPHQSNIYATTIERADMIQSKAGSVSTITAVDSQTQITVDRYLFGSVYVEINIVHKTNTVRFNYAECNGDLLSDPDSVYNGAKLPNINGSTDMTKLFLRGSTSGSGATSVPTHTHDVTLSVSGNAVGSDSVAVATTYTTTASMAIPPYYEVVFIIRVK